MIILKAIINHIVFNEQFWEEHGKIKLIIQYNRVYMITNVLYFKALYLKNHNKYNTLETRKNVFKIHYSNFKKNVKNF